MASNRVRLEFQCVIVVGFLLNLIVVGLNVYELPLHFLLWRVKRYSGYAFADNSCNGRSFDNRNYLPVCFGAFSERATVSGLRFDID